ncbi:MAG: TadE/TadG family type IV pilus assembly protein [Acidimicrobiales bacterium]
MRGQRRGSRLERDAGATLLEFAIVSVLLFALLFGIIEFGYQFNNYQAVRQGVREASRQGAVVRFGTDSACGLTSLSGTPSADVQKLMCLTKNQVGLGDGATRVKVLLGDPDIAVQQSTGYVEGNSLVVCAETRMSSLTGMFAPIVDSKVLKSKTTIRIEQDAPTAQRDGQEAAHPGSSWGWCTLTGAAP